MMICEKNETRNETTRSTGSGRAHDPSGVFAGQRGGGCEIRTREGLPPTRFPTMLASVHHSPPPSVTCPNTTWVAAGERLRTGVNETETETEGQAALHGAARLRSD